MITDKKETYTVDYPEAIHFAETQASIYWRSDEIKVEKDVQDILVNLTEAERHGVITVLKLFTLYELNVGNEYWGGVIAKQFPRPDIQRMANAFSFFELNVHAPFYAKINEVLGLATDEFYSSYIDDSTLRGRMEYIDGCLQLSEQDECIKKLIALAAFSMIEGAVLYSSFAYLKHFQACGKNKLINIVRGVDMSVRDEALHSEAGAWLFRTLSQESNLSLEDVGVLKIAISNVQETIREHEHKIVDMIFEKGKIEGITAHQMKNFVDSRIDLCLSNLGYEKVYKPEYNPIAEWFYTSINAYKFNDFFTGIGREYNRNWDEDSFIWKTEE